MTEDIAKDAVDALREELDKTGPDDVDSGNKYGWDIDQMNTSQTETETEHEEVDEEYADVEGDTPDPNNDEGSDGNPRTGTKSESDKQVSDAVTERPDVDEVEIGHLEINEYYRVWIDEPEQAPPEVEVFTADEAQAPPPTESASHYYDAPFEASTAAVGIEDAAEKLQEYDVDTSFPGIRDISKSEVSQADLWLISAARAGSPEKVTRTSVEMAKSPLTLFYVSKWIRDRPKWSGVRKYIRDELESRGVVALDKIRRADKVKAKEPRGLNKRKVYVQEESDVPDQYEPQYGVNDGLYYVPDGDDDDSIDGGEDLEDKTRDILEDDDRDIVDEVPVQAWRDYTGQIEDQDLLVKALDPIQDHGTKTARDRIRQRLRGMGLEGGEIDDLLADSDAPYSGEEHEEWQDDYEDMDVVESEALWNTDAKAGASAEHMYVEELGDGTTAFVTRYGANEGNDPEARSRQMATYKASRALTAEGNVPPHVSTDTIQPDEDYVDEYNKVAVKEFDGQEAWEAPDSYFEEVDRDDYVEQTAKQLLCGNNDLHGDNVMVNEDGDLGFHDLDHSAGRLDQNDPFNAGDVVEGALSHMMGTANYMNLVEGDDLDEVNQAKAELAQEIIDTAQDIAEERGDEVRQLLEETEDPHIREMLENIVYNLEAIEGAEAGLNDMGIELEVEL